MKIRVRVSLNLSVVFVLHLMIIVRFETSEENDVKSVLMVCYTNKCRSPISAAVFNSIAKKRGLDSQWHAESAGIAADVRQYVDNKSEIWLRTQYGIELNNLTQKLNLADFDKFDYMLGVDDYCFEYLEHTKMLLGHHRPPRGNKTKHIGLFTAYDPEGMGHIAKVPKTITRAEYWYQLASRSSNGFLDKFSNDTKKTNVET